MYLKVEIQGNIECITTPTTVTVEDKAPITYTEEMKYWAAAMSNAEDEIAGIDPLAEISSHYNSDEFYRFELQNENGVVNSTESIYVTPKNKIMINLNQPVTEIVNVNVYSSTGDLEGIQPLTFSVCDES